MDAQYFVRITDHTSVPVPDDERVGPFHRYEDAERWIEERSEQFVESLSERYQDWLEAQEGDAPVPDDDSRVEWVAASGQTVVYDSSGAPAATYIIEEEEGADA